MPFVCTTIRSLRDAAVALTVALLLAALACLLARGLLALLMVPDLAREVSRSTPPSRFASSTQTRPAR